MQIAGSEARNELDYHQPGAQFRIALPNVAECANTDPPNHPAATHSGTFRGGPLLYALRRFQR